jgi:hypothetical protein
MIKERDRGRLDDRMNEIATSLCVGYDEPVRYLAR